MMEAAHALREMALQAIQLSRSTSEAFKTLIVWVARIEKELADARSDIHDLQTRLSELETD
jgi:hypothetical protein